MSNKYVPKRCINKFVNYKMKLQKKVNVYKAVVFSLIFVIGLVYVFYFLCKWHYSIANNELNKIPSYLFSNKPSILHKRVLSIFFTTVIYPIIHFLNSIKGFGVFKVKTKQNKRSRKLMEHLSWIFELDTSFSIALGIVNKEKSTAIIIVILFFVMIAVFCKNFKDTDKASFDCDRYINEQKKKGFNISKCTFCNFNTFNYIALFKNQCIIMKTNNIINISKNEFSNMMDNMW